MARLSRTRRTGLALLVTLLGVGACSSPKAASPRVSVVAAFYPLAHAVERVGRVHVTVQNLTPAGAEPHDLELTASQSADVQDAKAVFLMGRGFQPAVEKAARPNRGTVAILDLLPAAVVGDGHDPHVWLDPVLMGAIVNVVRDALVKIDPAHRDEFTANAATFGRELSRLDATYRAGLASCERHELVTSHEAFGFVARRYGLAQHSIIGLGPDAEPGPGRLGELTDLVKREHVTTVFTETLVSAKVAQTLARETGVRTDVLNPIEGLTKRERARGESYLSLMQKNLAKIRIALGCA